MSDGDGGVVAGHGVAAPVVSVRPADVAELAEIGELTVAAYQADGFALDGHPYAARLADAAARQRDAELLVAADQDDRVLGTVTVVRPGTPYAEISTAGELEFRMLAVRPDARGQGIARLLVTAVVDQARAEGCVAVVLSSLDRMRNAHRLYQRFGFRRTPERDSAPALWAFVLDL
ncbi:MAG TPA: GNAT family N-acetyltransferase [Pseudonocardiaceae bacterium]|jgi:GNAT superfamily N-acetyltransferase|nr:GNAT family N-acetyltransferase [Pseudonocardiaceae bacterium]